jgi:hypothetical protein
MVTVCLGDAKIFRLTWKQKQAGCIGDKIKNETEEFPGIILDRRIDAE